MPNLRRISDPKNEWGPVVRHGDGFQPPQYIQNEIDGKVHGKGIKVVFDGRPAVFYKSYYDNAGRVTFELEIETCGLASGWYHISNGINSENLNRTIIPGMEFILIC